MPFSLKTVMKINAKVCQPLCSKTPGAEGQSPEREQGVSSKETKTGKPGSGNKSSVSCVGPVLDTPPLTFDPQILDDQGPRGPWEREKPLSRPFLPTVPPPCLVV